MSTPPAQIFPGEIIRSKLLEEENKRLRTQLNEYEGSQERVRTIEEKIRNVERFAQITDLQQKKIIALTKEVEELREINQTLVDRISQLSIAIEKP